MQVIVAPEPPPIPDPIFVDQVGMWQEIGPLIAICGLLVASAFLLYPLARAWARRIEGKGADPMLLEEVTQLRDRMSELDHVSARLHELEERLDFAERLLVQRDATAIPRGEGQH